MEKPSREHHSRSPPDEDRGQNCRQFKGIRKRKWASWGSEIRMPKTRKKIWLGSYKTAEQAARAYDAALYCLRGPNAKFNFPDSVPDIPSASSFSCQQIQAAAAKYAVDDTPSTSPSPRDIKNNDNKARKNPAPSSIRETEWACDSRQIYKPQDLGLWEAPYGGLNLEKIPSIEEATVLQFIPAWQEEMQEGYIDLWNFGDS